MVSETQKSNFFTDILTSKKAKKLVEIVDFKIRPVFRPVKTVFPVHLQHSNRFSVQFPSNNSKLFSIGKTLKPFKAL